MSEPLQLLDPSGELVGDAPFDLEETRRLYRALVAARLYDHKASALQRQGRLATYSPFEGQEAAQIGSAAALRPDDWMVGTYRDAAAMWLQGYSWVNLFMGRTGDERGGKTPEGSNVLPPSITVGAHMIHAVGLGWAERLTGSDRIAITYFGDGATSEGDFHEAMNFAGVYSTPTVFLCQNNGFAISMSRAGQTAAESIAAKGAGYGVPALQVDGNDLFAVFAATSQAVGRARSGGGPTLIEALTYRIGPHTTTDDAGRYRDEADVEMWRGRDPLERVRRYLEAAGAWDAAWQEEIDSEEGALIEEAAAAAEAVPTLTPDEMFGAMFAAETAPLSAQRAMLERDQP